MQERKDYNALVNPTFETAKITSYLLLQTQDKNSQKFSEILNIKDPFKNSQTNIILNDLFRIIAAINNEARYRAVTYNLAESGYKNLVDLACGYTHRGLDTIEAGINYVGIDVPTVVNELNHAFENSAEKVIPKYVAGDVTNYSSIKKATENLNGELFITSEGLITYLNKAELAEMSKTIKKLLLEHGGSWLLTDTTNFLTKAFGVLIKDDPSLKSQLDDCFKYLNQDRGILAESTDTTDEATIRKFLEDNGFKIDEVPYYSDKFPVKLLDALSESQREKILTLLKSLTVWKITPIPTDFIDDLDLNGNFEINASMNDGVLTLTVKGRLDSLSSAELLELFDKNKTDSLEKLIIQGKDISFISSTGSRTLNRIIDELDNTKVVLQNFKPQMLSSTIIGKVDLE